MLVDGVPVEYRRVNGSIAADHVRVIDFDNPDNNEQFYPIYINVLHRHLAPNTMAR